MPNNDAVRGNRDVPSPVRRVSAPASLTAIPEIDASDDKHVVLGLLFLEYISDFRRPTATSKLPRSFIPLGLGQPDVR
jgi:hypothetical protein